MHRISSNNSRGQLLYFLHKKGGDYSRKGDYFKYCSLEVVPFIFCFIIPLKQEK